ncbi:MAG: hypothetical protein H6519_05575 [Microthrixaceae bacterium]|nr:hypothetical protein [Acidimicrobiales bacterium]MCB9403888.1 hypothetical protein [Microthrixaceae bacterium]
MNEPRATHWWARRFPSVMTLVGLLVGMIVVTVMLTRQAVDVLPEVGRDQLGEDNWADPLGVHLAGPLQVARVPDCAAGAFTRLVLWDPMSDPYWEVEGPPTPLTSFVVGAAPEGFTTLTPYRDPPRGALLRLVAFRRDAAPVGIRYRSTDLRPTRIVSGNPLTRFTIEGFQTAEVCETSDNAVTSTTGSDPGLELGTTVPPELDISGSNRSSTTIDDGTGPGGP